MKLIVCLDERNGMAWNCRRQSRDRKVTEDIAQLVGEAPLFISPYTRSLFDGYALDLHLSDAPMRDAPQNAYCFLELESPDCCDAVEEMIVYRWNRHYPSDVTFHPESFGFGLVACSEFIGYSHEKITKEVFKK